jgi:Ser/Thr protein kinase RdoA (MazF antagonist)
MWADIPLTVEILELARAAFGIDTSAEPERLHGGEESAAYRVGEHVIRLSPTWRDDLELEWCYAIATLTSRRVSEAVAPLRTEDGRCVLRVGGRPVTVWPHIDGTWADDEHWAQAAALLARLHRVLGQYSVAPRPAETSPVAETPELDDPDLDRAISQLHDRYPRRHPLHGDCYHGNILVKGGRIAGLVDWDNAFVGPPEEELAWAAWEWSDARDRLDPSQCAEFVDAYRAAGGPAAAIDEATIATVVRARLRWEIGYSRAMRDRGVGSDADYEAESVAAFFALKRFTSPR